MQPTRTRHALLLALTALLVLALLPAAAAGRAKIPTVDVTPRLSPGPAYDFHTAGGRITCNLVVGAHGTAVGCAGPTKSASLLWSGLVTMPAGVDDGPGKSRLVRAGTRLRIHVPSDRLVYVCRAFGTAMQCKHSRTGHGFLVGLTVARRV
jgi:hypothetical protein